MEDKNVKESGTGIPYQINFNDEQKGIISAGGIPEISDKGLVFRFPNTVKSDPKNSGKDIGTETKIIKEESKSVGLANGYNFENALAEYDSKEQEPQIAEHWTFNDPNIKARRHF